MRAKIFSIAIAACVATAGDLLAEQIGWGDLAPSFSASENPFYGLSADEARLLGLLVDVDAARKSGEPMTYRMAKGEAIALAALRSVGIDGEEKVRAVTAFGSRLDESRTELNEDLLDTKVEIAGFALPLEFDGIEVTEFILVPYAGACIHTPPPPSNQMIIVSLKKGFQMRSIFEPVVISGKLGKSGVDTQVDLSDGTSVFSVGYEMRARRVRTF